MVAQECPPSLRRRPSAADHVFGNRRLDDLLLGMTHSRPTRYSQFGGSTTITPSPRSVPKTGLRTPSPIANMLEHAGIRRSRGLSKLLSSAIALRSIAAKAFRTGLVIDGNPKERHRANHLTHFAFEGVLGRAHVGGVAPSALGDGLPRWLARSQVWGGGFWAAHASCNRDLVSISHPKIPALAGLVLPSPRAPQEKRRENDRNQRARAEIDGALPGFGTKSSVLLPHGS